MEIEFDEAKRLNILQERGLDMAEAGYVFTTEHYQVVDDRKDYGEPRFRVWGYLRGKRVYLVWTPRDGKRRIVTMYPTHEREHQARLRTLD
ncbi:BrnT family toxin [Novosphingobium lentum]|uniref:BrnT family toxin n=1 Tax=Novosphingobium lentum TaxID=145287 RepID=UPI0009FE85CB|nr:BrnT family toxin [Novosphingobium lentum]